MHFDVAEEHVSLFLRDGRVRALCTCGAERCTHVETALRFLASTSSAPPAEARTRSSRPPPPPSVLPDLSAIGHAFDELRLAVARTGTLAPDSPSIREALDQLLQRVGQPTPLGLSRWVARFQEALSAGEVGKVARVLDGVRELSEELIAGVRSPEALARRRAWLDAGEGFHVALTDATLIELARERLAGLSRASIERRYLMNLESGEVLKEERRTNDPDASVGPCPRVVHAAFAEVHDGSAPRRVRLLQYTIGARPTAEHWERVRLHATRSVRELSLRYAEANRKASGLAEPFVVFAPKELSEGVDARLCDNEGDSILLADEVEAATVHQLRALAGGGEVVFVAGRLAALSDGLVLKPASLLVHNTTGPHLYRVT